MNNTTASILTFIAGAAIGSVATWAIVKKKYEKIAQEEIQSVKDVYARRNETKNVETVVEDTVEFTDEERDEYVNISQSQSYVSPDDLQTLAYDKPYVVSPYEFGELEDYDRFTLTYYADGFVTDENDCLLEDIENHIGFESLSHFGEYSEDPDTVYVRNDRLKCDYEILRDERKYEDILNGKRYLVNDLEVENE